MLRFRAINVFFVTSVVAMVALFTAVMPAHAQEVSGVVVVAIPDEFPALPESFHTEAVVFGALMYEPGQPDLILLHPRQIAPPFLAQAVEALRRSREAAEQNPALATRAHTGLLVTTAMTASAMPLPAMVALLDELRRQPKVEIPGVGPGRLMHVEATRLEF